MKRHLVAALCTLVLAPTLTSCVPEPRTDQSETLREVKPMLSSAVDEVVAMFPEASARTSGNPDELSSCAQPKNDNQDGEWRSNEIRFMEFSGDVDQAQLLDDISNHMAAEGWGPADNGFTNGVDRLGLSHANGGYLSVATDVKFSNILVITSMSDCYYLPEYYYKDDFQ